MVDDFYESDVEMVSHSRAPSRSSSRYSIPPITESEGASTNDQFNNDTDFETNKGQSISRNNRKKSKHLVRFLIST